MKKIIIIAIFAIFYQNVNAQIDSIIYGVNSNQINRTISLGKINPFTGEVLQISQTIYPYTTINTGRTIDPVKKIYYLTFGSVLLAFDLSSGNLLTSNSITQLVNSSFFGINFNYPNSTLYGISIDTISGDHRLAQLDPIAGVVYKLSNTPLPDHMSIAFGNAIDPYKSIYYYVSTNHKIVGVDLSTGNLLTDPTVSISAGSFGPIVFNCQDSTLYGLEGDMTNGRKFAKINPQSGLVSLISSTNIAMGIYSDMATVDPFKNLYYFKNADNQFVGVDMSNGEIYSNPTIVPISNTNFYDFLYNSSCTVNYPVGNSDNEPQLQNISLFPNPVVDLMRVTFNEATSGNIDIISILGVKIISKEFLESSTVNFNLSVLQKGMYFVKVTQKNFNKTITFVKN